MPRGIQIAAKGKPSRNTGTYPLFPCWQASAGDRGGMALSSPESNVSEDQQQVQLEPGQSPWRSDSPWQSQSQAEDDEQPSRKASADDISDSHMKLDLDLAFELDVDLSESGPGTVTVTGPGTGTDADADTETGTGIGTEAQGVQSLAASTSNSQCLDSIDSSTCNSSRSASVSANANAGVQNAQNALGQWSFSPTTTSWPTTPIATPVPRSCSWSGGSAGTSSANTKCTGTTTTPGTHRGGSGNGSSGSGSGTCSRSATATTVPTTVPTAAPTAGCTPVSAAADSWPPIVGPPSTVESAGWGISIDTVPSSRHGIDTDTNLLVGTSGVGVDTSTGASSSADGLDGLAANHRQDLLAPPLRPPLAATGPTPTGLSLGLQQAHPHPHSLPHSHPPSLPPQPLHPSRPPHRRAGSVDGHHLQPHHNPRQHQSYLHRRPRLVSRSTLPSSTPRLASVPTSASSVPTWQVPSQAHLLSHPQSHPPSQSQTLSRCSTPRRHHPGAPLAFTSASALPITTAPRAAAGFPQSTVVAMPGRPAAGSVSMTKRAADDGVGEDGTPGLGASAKMKLPRLDRGSEDFSSVVKNRLSSYTRTGQACDRCKVRKIRCDALPEGCSHCINLGLECNVTDRVTGRTERRGYMQQLEREKTGMTNHIQELERLLNEKGIEVKPYSSHPGGQPHPAPHDHSNSSDPWAQFGSLWIKDGSATKVPSSSDSSSPNTQLRPNFPRCRLESRPEHTTLGIGWDSRPLSSVKGTTLTIMGTTIDTTSFDAPDMDDPPADSTGTAPLYNKSVQAFFQSVMGVNPPLHVELPSRDDAFTYAQWYFLIMANYFPVLHKPTFMKLLARIYDEPGFVPPTPELVQVHMVFAIIYYQYGVRNWQETERRDQLNDLSNKHYHFSLSKMFDLMTSRDLAAIQAMVLMACHTRAFPKPGCGALISNFAFQRALELNLHRAPKLPPSGTNLAIEMRKRTWWVMISMFVSTTGRRGRPMPIAVEDFDVPLPEPINDDDLRDDGVEKTSEDSLEWEVGMAMFRIVPILMEMYANIYSVRTDSQNYARIIYALEDELQKWEDDLPPNLRFNHDNSQNSLAAICTRQFGLEMRLWMRHNSSNPTSDKKMMAENTRICEETSREILHGVQQLIAIKSLDTTWTQTTIFAMCIFCMLVAHWERRFETTPEKVRVLRQEMDDWMEVLKECSLILCCGPELQDEIKRMIDRTIGWIEHDMQNKASRPRVMSATAAAAKIKKENSAPEAVSQISAPSSDTPPQMPSSAPPVSHPPPQPPQPAYQQPSQPPSQPSQEPQHTPQPPQPQPQQAHQAPQPQPQPPQQQHQASHPAPQQQAPTQPAAAYYPDSNVNGHAAYPGYTYGEQPQAAPMAPQTYENEALFYPNAQQAGAVAAAAAVASGGEAQSNPLIAFASQATPQHVDPSNQFYWPRAEGNTWQDWTAAIAQSHERFGGGGMMSMGGPGAAANGPRGSVHSMVDGTSGPEDMAAQWPLVMFHEQHQPEHQQQQQQQHHHQAEHQQQQHQQPPQHHPQHQHSHIPPQHQHQHPHHPHPHPHPHQHHHGTAGV